MDFYYGKKNFDFDCVIVRKFEEKYLVVVYFKISSCGTGIKYLVFDYLG